MTRPLGDAAGDAERWWQAYRLAESDQAGELGERAEARDEHATICTATLWRACSPPCSAAAINAYLMR